MRAEGQLIPTPSGPLEYAVFLQRLSDGETIYQFKADQPYEAASLAKLYIAAAVFHQAEGGFRNLRYPLPISAQEFKEGNYGTGRLRWKLALSGRVAQRFPYVPILPYIPLESLLKEMVHHSDNLATLTVVNAIGRDHIQWILDDWSLHQTTIKNPEKDTLNTTTASDMGKFLSKLGRGELLESQHTAQLLSWMQRPNIPRAEVLLNGVLYKEDHVTGGGKSYYHLAGFITDFQNRLDPKFTFVVLTRDHAYPYEDITYKQWKVASDSMDWMLRSLP